jgi:hypothetical protein
MDALAESVSTETYSGPSPVRARVLTAVAMAMALAVVANVAFLQPGQYRDGLAGLENGANVSPITTAGVDQSRTLETPPEAVWHKRLQQLEAEVRAPQQAGPDLMPETVETVQRELARQGYDPGGADGRLGGITRAAILAFEFDHGLPLSGTPSDQLLKRLLLGASGADNGSRSAHDDARYKDLVRSIQSALESLGYGPGAATGTLTPKTIAAIRKFEAQQKIGVSGRISGQLILRLARAASKSFQVGSRD